MSKNIDSRGLRTYTRFKDGYGDDVSLRDSITTGIVKIFSKNEKGENAFQHHVTGELVGLAPFLSPSMAVRLAKALLRFANKYQNKKYKIVEKVESSD